MDLGSGFTSVIVDETIVVTLDSNNNILSTTNSFNVTLDSVGGLVSGEAVDLGDLTFLANTITELVGTNIQIISVTNPDDFTAGRDRETDAELRLRMAEREQSTGTATKPAIEASISEVDGVTGVLVVENIDIGS